MLTKKEQKAIVDAHKHGKTIQVKENPRAEWKDMVLPVWNFDKFEYRERPVNTKTVLK
ncbi:MAG: hypothetical protein MJZ34_02365 [Paludibacteraceae bacterium]|nr:hypothetical protein [Paludibacteraceae bacterium]